jgi:YtoQ family protein
MPGSSSEVRSGARSDDPYEALIVRGRVSEMTHEGADGTWTVYLAGEIDSDWREPIAAGIRDAGLPVELLAPVTDHAASDDVGVGILGEEESQLWRDHKSAGINAVRTQTLLRRADVVVVRFDDECRQWNVAFEAGYAAALGKPIIALHDPELTHPLKGVDRAAMAVAEAPDQVVEILRYVIVS